MDNQLKAGSKEVQQVVRRHYAFLKKFWTPTKESYPSHGRFIVETELRNAYEAFHPQMSEFISEAIHVFASQEL